MTIITIAAHIKQEIAEKVVAQASAGYSKTTQGAWFVVNGTSVVHLSPMAAWKPWREKDETISVDDLVWHFGGAAEENADFTDYEADAEGYAIAVEFALGYVPDSYSATEAAAIYGE